MTKEEFLKEMKARMDELNYRWSIERNKFEAKAQHLGAEAREKFEDQRQELRRLRREMKEKILELEVAGENAWEDVREGAEKAWKALNKSFKKAASRFGK